LERHLAREQIKSLTVKDVEIERPTNGNDVAKVAVAQVPAVLKQVKEGAVLWKGADMIGDALNNGGNKVEANEGSTVTIVDNEEHTTALGNDTQARSRETPVVVQEESVEEEEVLEEEVEEEEEEEELTDEPAGAGEVSEDE
jgi:hypothetical protein